MTASSRRWEGRRWDRRRVCFPRLAAQLRPRDGRRSAGLRRVSPAQALLFAPGLAAAAQGCQRGDTGGQVPNCTGGYGSGDGDSDPARQGHCCHGVVLSGGKQRSGRREWSFSLPCTQGCHVKGWTRGPGGCASAGSSQKQPGVVGGKQCSRDTRGFGVPQRDGCSGTVCMSIPFTPLLPPAFPHACPAARLWGGAVFLRCCWGRAVVGMRYLGVAGSWGKSWFCKYGGVSRVPRAGTPRCRRQRGFGAELQGSSRHPPGETRS